MFSADLPLTDGGERVGERRERKAQERSNTLYSFETTTSSGSVSSSDQEQWWASSLKKAKSVKSNILRPSNRSPTSRRTDQALPKELNIKLAQEFKDPAMQPGWTYSSTLSPTLPSGAPLDRLELDLPDLEGDTSSWQTESVDSHQSYDLRWGAGSPNNVTGSREASTWEKTSPRSLKTNRTRPSSVCTEREPLAPSANSENKRKSKRRPKTVMIEGSLSLDALKLHDALEEGKVSHIVQDSPIDNLSIDSRFNFRPLSQWDCLAPRRVPMGMQLTPESFVSQLAPAHGDPAEPRFQRFIRQMKSAAPQMILDRIEESLHEPTGESADEELILERQLWLLTGFQMQVLGKAQATPSPACDTGRMLELYGNLSEVYQLSAMHPSQTVHFLTTKLQRSIPLPSNVSYLTVRDLGSVPLPYPENYFSHIRASTLPSLVPSANLPELFNECYKLLAPGGLLEIRIMDAAPLRKSTGPLMRTWIEDRLSVNLEKLFRCSKPCLLVPVWLTDAKFELCHEEVGQTMTLPCAFDKSSANTDKELSTMIGRCLWKDIWGSFVEPVSDKPKWWWEEEKIVDECVKRQTALECRTIFAYKR